MVKNLFNYGDTELRQLLEKLLLAAIITFTLSIFTELTAPASKKIGFDLDSEEVTSLTQFISIVEQ